MSSVTPKHLGQSSTRANQDLSFHSKHDSGTLLRVLGVGFGLAVTIGGTIGMGILRTPGEVAKELPTPTLFIGIWIAGGIYALLGAISIAYYCSVRVTAEPVRCGEGGNLGHRPPQKCSPTIGDIVARPYV